MIHTWYSIKDKWEQTHPIIILKNMTTTQRAKLCWGCNYSWHDSMKCRLNHPLNCVSDCWGGHLEGNIWDPLKSKPIPTSQECGAVHFMTWQRITYTLSQCWTSVHRETDNQAKRKQTRQLSQWRDASGGIWKIDPLITTIRLQSGNMI